MKVLVTPADRMPAVWIALFALALIVAGGFAFALGETMRQLEDLQPIAFREALASLECPK